MRVEGKVIRMYMSYLHRLLAIKKYMGGKCEVEVLSIHISELVFSKLDGLKRK